MGIACQSDICGQNLHIVQSINAEFGEDIDNKNSFSAFFILHLVKTVLFYSEE